MTQTDVVAGGALTDLVSLGVLAAAVPRDVVDEAVAVTGRGARRAGGKLPPHLMVYFVMALALFADEDYEEVAARLTGALREWGEQDWEVPTPGGITQARQRLGAEPMAEVFGQVAVPVAGLDTVGAFVAGWRLMSLDGMEWDVPDSPANRAFFGVRAGPGGQGAFPKLRVVTISECGSHAPVAAVMGPAGKGKGTGERTLARSLLGQAEEGWLLLADRNFYCFTDWCTAADTGADLLWRVRRDARLAPLKMLPDGSWLSVLIQPTVTPCRRAAIVAAARRGEDLDACQARYVRVISYDVPDRAGGDDDDDGLIVLVTTITSPQAAPAADLAAAYHQRWEHETGNQQLKTYLRGPGKVLRSRSPQLAEQEIWGYLLAHYAISALICEAATNAGIDPDRVKFKRTLRIIRRAVGPAFPP
jgi:Insertion element 4 transposase N-terminal/Transposase DDE domain